MKNSYLIILGLAMFSGIANSQTQQVLNYPALDNSKALGNPEVQFLNRKAVNKTTDVETFWFSYTSAMNDYLTNQGNSPSFTRNGNYLYPDSLPIARFGSDANATYGAPWVHAVAAVMDLNTPAFTSPGGNAMSPGNVYTVDSVAITMSYHRNMADTSIRDTLLVYIINNNSGSGSNTNLPAFSFGASWSANWNVPKVSFQDVLWDSMSVIENNVYSNSPHMVPRASGPFKNDIMEIKYILSAEDSSASDPTTGTFYLKTVGIALPTPMTVNPSKRDKNVAIFYTFKPGYNYSLGDSLSNINYMRFFSYEENQGDFQTYIANDFNCSFILPQGVRYGTSTGWPDMMIPSYAYTAPYSFEYHTVMWHLTVENIGIGNSIDKEGNKIYEVYPNPIENSNVLTIPFELSKAANVSFQLIDAQGRVITQNISGRFNEGKNRTELSVNGLSAGLYYLQMNVNGSITSRTISVK